MKQKYVRKKVLCPHLGLNLKIKCGQFTELARIHSEGFEEIEKSRGVSNYCIQILIKHKVQCFGVGRKVTNYRVSRQVADPISIVFEVGGSSIILIQGRLEDHQLSCLRLEGPKYRVSGFVGRSPIIVFEGRQVGHQVSSLRQDGQKVSFWRVGKRVTKCHVWGGYVVNCQKYCQYTSLWVLLTVNLYKTLQLCNFMFFNLLIY